MKKLLLLICLFPALIQAQSKKKSKASSTNEVQLEAGSYKITGTLTGYNDGTVIDLVNPNTRIPEATAKLSNGSFTLSGKLESPDIKLLTFDKSNAFIPIFLDYSNVTVTAKNGELQNASVIGSKSHDEFIQYNTIIRPYDQLFSGNGASDPAQSKKCADGLESFVKQNSSSFVAPLAIYRINQLTDNGEQMERLFNGLTGDVKSSPIGGYIAQQIAEAKRNPMGKPLPDFSQEDTNGKLVSFSSFKGKYVLVDFWASWCGPCRQENPNVVRAYNKYKGKNFTVLGISLDKSKQPWLDAIQADGLTWQHLSDLKGWTNAVAQKFGINSIPQNFLVDPNGVVIGKNLRGADLDSKLEEILK